MPRYYFHLKDGAERLLDPEGREIAEPDQVPAISLNEARALIAQEALQGRINLSQRLEVEDGAGRLFHVVRFKDAVDITP